MLRHLSTVIALAALLPACGSGVDGPSAQLPGDVDIWNGTDSPLPTLHLTDDEAVLLEGEVTTIDVLANDVGVIDAAVDIAITREPGHADVVVLGSGALSIVAHLGYNGPDVLAYTVTYLGEEPHQGILLCENDQGKRTLALCEDQDRLTAMTHDEFCHQEVELAGSIV